jgi:hypothetical protein
MAMEKSCIISSFISVITMIDEFFVTRGNENLLSPKSITACPGLHSSIKLTSSLCRSLLLITAHYLFDTSTPYRHRSFTSLSAFHLLTAGVRHTLEIITTVHGQYSVDLD